MLHLCQPILKCIQCIHTQFLNSRELISPITQPGTALFPIHVAASPGVARWGLMNKCMGTLF